MSKYIEAMANGLAYAVQYGGVCCPEDEAKAALTALIKTLREDPGAVEAIRACWQPEETTPYELVIRDALADYLERME